MARRVGIIGGGSWATALTWVLAQNGHSLQWWVRDEHIRRGLQLDGRNGGYLPGLTLPMEQIKLAETIHAAVEGVDSVLFIVPAAYLADTVAPLMAQELQDKYVVSAIKGLEVHAGLTMQEFFTARFVLEPERYAAISGPSHAEEVVQGKITFLTVGAAAQKTADHIGSLLRMPNLFVRSSGDVVGMEYSAILKNIYAIGTGLALGLGYGDNFISVFVTACLQETERFLAAHAPHSRNIADSAYLGDLLVTAYSPHSRNRNLGRLIGTGLTPDQALSEMKMVAEGYFAAKLLAQRFVRDRLPIAHGVYEVLHEGADPAAILMGLCVDFV